MKRLILIDGMNFYFKGSFVGQLNVNGKSVKYVYAFLRNILSLMKIFEKDNSDDIFVICWDGGYKQRLRISEEAVMKGLIPKSYKQERRQANLAVTEEEKIVKEEFNRQLKEVWQMMEFTRIYQCRIWGEEADDLIGSYVYKYKDCFDEIVLVTSDRDYFQLLEKNVKIYNSSKKEFRDINYLKKEFNLDNNRQWIDVGALAGENGSSSDTIYGVPGISYKTGSKLISQYKSLENLLNETKIKFSEQIERCGGIKNFCDEVELGNIKLKECKKEIKILSMEEILKLAYELKKMRTFLDVNLSPKNIEWDKLDEYIRENRFVVSRNDFDRLVKNNELNTDNNFVQEELF